jgi:hypothetical protein
VTAGPEQTKVVAPIIAAARKRGAKIIKTHGGAYGRGQPDLFCVYRGRVVIVECKAPGKRHNTTKLQDAELEQWRLAGAITDVVDSPAQFTAILDAIDGGTL